MAGPDARRAKGLLEFGGVWEGMPTPLTRWSAELPVQIEKRGARNVALNVFVVPGRPAEPPPHVDHCRWSGCGEEPGQCGYVDERHGIQ